MIEKFNLQQAKTTHLFPCSNKLRDYQPSANFGAIRRVLIHEAPDYVRRTKKIPDDKLCITYLTKQGKVAVLTLETPKKRLLFRQAEAEQYSKGISDKMNALKEKYGFIPRPINVLRKFVDYGYMKSQDVEHLYHNKPVDWQITDAREEMEAAYRERFHEKDVLIDNFNGYSCMSEEPDVGTFYYFFGAKMLIFYDKENTSQIVGRMVLWPWKDKLYAYKGYVKTNYQFSASVVVNNLAEKGKIIRDSLPSDFKTSLQNMGDKTPEEIYEEICDTCRVPYIDEDLELNEEKTELSFSGGIECKGTAVQTLRNYGKCVCEECGDEVDEEDGVWVGDYFYCTRCAQCCHCCDEWYAPDEDGYDTKYDGWVCEHCIDKEYEYCEECEEYVHKDDILYIRDEDGDWIEMCKECVDNKGCKICKECCENYIPRSDDPDECELCAYCRNHMHIQND